MYTYWVGAAKSERVKKMRNSVCDGKSLIVPNLFLSDCSITADLYKISAYAGVVQGRNVSYRKDDESRFRYDSAQTRSLRRITFSRKTSAANPEPQSESSEKITSEENMPVDGRSEGRHAWPYYVL